VEDRELVLEKLPRLRVSRVRPLLRSRGDIGKRPFRVRLKVSGEATTIVLEPARRTFGVMLYARCQCGRRALVLYRDPRDGAWCCSACLGVPTARDRWRKNRVFRTVLRPILDLERAGRRTAYATAPRWRRELFAQTEKRTLEQVQAALIAATVPAARPERKEG